MNRVILSLAALLPVLLSAPGAAGAEWPEKPNIVLILADDLGAECLGCYGGKSYETPNLDRLAAAGLRFDRCYALPVCSPSRGELLTGRYSFRTEITHVILPGAPGKLDVQRHRTFVQLLRDGGYATCIAGKWHLCLDFLDHPRHVADAGFEDRYLWRLFRDRAVQRHYWNPELWIEDRPADEVGKGKFGDDLFTEHVVQFMRAHRDRPFFVYYPMTLVHSQTATGKNYPPSPDVIRPGDDPDEGVQPRQKGFAQLVAYTDKLAGRIVEEVDRLGLGEKTLILFAGDNGTDRTITSRLGDRDIPGGKGSLTEAGTRVPLIARWPGIVAPGGVAEELVDFTDFFPTILEAAGVAMPPGYQIDGRTFLARLRGEPYKGRDWVYRHYQRAWCIRGDRYRLDSTGKFWDLGADPYDPKPAGAGPEATAARKRLAAAAAELRGTPER